MSQQVEAILQQIESLNEADRAILEQRLQELAECRWQSEANEARSLARKRGISQTTIDAAVDELRYGP
jgi:hypothetical protein